MSTLLDRLKERKIVQWALAYLAVSYGLLEVFDLLSDPFGDADAIKRALVALFGFGLVITLVLAWFHAEKGRQHATAVELVVLAILAVGAIPAAVFSYRLDSGVAPAMDAGIRSVLSGPVVAVLPFDNISAGEEGAAFIVAGIHGEILTNLSRFSGINVISRTSVLGYERAGRTVRQIADDLGVSAILEGSIQIVGRSIRINVSLIDAFTDVQLWGDIFNRVVDPESVFSVQSEIASRIAEALAVTLAPAEQSRLSHVPTRSQEALELFLLGKEAEDRANRGEFRYFQDALDYYEQAVAIDPSYADAQAARGGMILKVYWKVPGTPRTPELAESVRDAAELAIRLDSELATGHRLLGEYFMWYTTDAAAAIESFVAARRFDPDNVAALTGLAMMSMQAGDWETARADLYRAAQLDPRDFESQRLAVAVAIYTRRYDAADAHLTRAGRRFAPGFGTGEYDPEYQQLWRTIYKWRIGIYLAADGNTDRAHAALQELIEITEMNAAMLSLFLADIGGQNAFNVGPTLLDVDGVRDFLETEPRFHAPDAGWASAPRAWLLRVDGDDPDEERRLWSSWGDEQSDDQYGGAGTRGFTFLGAGSEVEARSQVALMFARAGRDEHARLQMGRAMEVQDLFLAPEIRLNAEPRWAMTLVELGEHEQALDLLEDMMSRPSAMSVGLLTVQPEWDAIREHPRFQALLEGG